MLDKLSILKANLVSNHKTIIIVIQRPIHCLNLNGSGGKPCRRGSRLTRKNSLAMSHALRCSSGCNNCAFVLPLDSHRIKLSRWDRNNSSGCAMVAISVNCHLAGILLSAGQLCVVNWNTLLTHCFMKMMYAHIHVTVLGLILGNQVIS